MKYILSRKNNKIYSNSAYVFSTFYVLSRADDFVKKKSHATIVSLNCWKYSYSRNAVEYKSYLLVNKSTCINWSRIKTLAKSKLKELKRYTCT